ncbi:3-phosphoshikimate 1-carboxyvinyltransferase [Candidatus Woesearchaeota archaeon]|nr:3-phosphoshikimate 1-carboxyvinyltransferase [Candidatus Woesearchaeota archaeon]
MNTPNIRELPYAKEAVNTTISIPGSKSYTNRALIIASLAEGETTLHNVLISDDTLYMMKALQAYGVAITVKETEIIVQGTGGKIKTPRQEIFVGNAGTAMRFLAGFAALANGTSRLNGDQRMQQRPIQDLINALQQAGISATATRGCPPITITGGQLKGGDIVINSEVSSQFITSLLLCSPYASNDVILHLTGKTTSRNYIDMTIKMMQDLGIHVERTNDGFRVRSGQRYHAREYTIEPDASSASYFFAAAAVTQGTIEVAIPKSSLQGDSRFVDALQAMGCEVKKKRSSIVVQGKPLHGITIDMNSMPDTAPTLAAVALCAEGKTTITNIGNLRVKECDRIHVLVDELRKIGADMREGKDWLSITPKKETKEYTAATLDPHADHRMVMSFAVAGLRIQGIQVKDPKCVSKSFPDFFQRWEAMLCTSS